MNSVLTTWHIKQIFLVFKINFDIINAMDILGRKGMVSIDIQKMDKKSRDMLAYLNTNTKLTSATLADAFNQHYKMDLDEALGTLSFLENKSLVKAKTHNDEAAIMIQVTHSGRTYEQELLEQEKGQKKKLWSDRFWNILTLALSSILTIVINLIMKWGFGI